MWDEFVLFLRKSRKINRLTSGLAEMEGFELTALLAPAR